MIRAAICGLLLVGCTPQYIELLSAASDGGSGGDVDGSTSYGFCPTSINVFGDDSATLQGCMQGSLASQLEQRLAVDQDIRARFPGISLRLNSCAASNETLPSLTPRLAGDSCFEFDDAATHQNDCTGGGRPNTPMVLLLANSMSDHCHGGGPDTQAPTDPQTFSAHAAIRLDSFINLRSPSLLLLSDDVSWRPVTTFGNLSIASCYAARDDWNLAALLDWQKQETPDPTKVIIFGDDLHALFKTHHGGCCRENGGMNCLQNWYSQSGDSLNCDGAQVLVDWWYQRLKLVLLQNRYSCAGPA